MVTEGNMEREYFDLSDRFAPGVSGVRKLEPKLTKAEAAAVIALVAVFSIAATGFGVLLAACWELWN